MKPEIKTFEFKADDVDSSGIIRGYAAAYNNVDLGFDVIHKGAFKKTIKDNSGRVPILADHDPYKQIGWNLRATEDNKGLAVEGKLDLNIALAKERYSLVKGALELGVKMGLSIGYQTIKSEPDMKNPRIRILKELKLYEYSIVTFPMNTDAMVTAAKQMGHTEALNNLINIMNESKISIKDLELALHKEAAEVDQDPFKLEQSLDNLISNFKI